MAMTSPAPPSVVPASPGWAPDHRWAPGAGWGAKPLDGLATALTVLLGVATLTSLFGAAAFANRVSAVGDVGQDGLFASLDRLDDADSLAGGAMALHIVVFIATAVVFIIWQHRHARNATMLRGQLDLGSGWAIGGWFIPVANYVLPGLQIRGAAKASDPGLAPGAPRQQGRCPAVVALWAVAFGGGSALLGVSVATRPDQDELGLDLTTVFQDFERADTVGAAAFAALVVAALAGLAMVRQLSRRQQVALGAASTAWAPPPPAPPPPWGPAAARVGQPWPPPAPVVSPAPAPPPPPPPP